MATTLPIRIAINDVSLTLGRQGGVGRFEFGVRPSVCFRVLGQLWPFDPPVDPFGVAESSLTPRLCRARTLGGAVLTEGGRWSRCRR